MNRVYGSMVLINLLFITQSIAIVYYNGLQTCENVTTPYFGGTLLYNTFTVVLLVVVGTVYHMQEGFLPSIYVTRHGKRPIRAGTENGR